MKSTTTILGCSGGIGEDLRTTSLLLDDDILIDAGTGVGDLSLNAMQKINTVFLTHSHLDHICSIAFLLDAVGVDRKAPLQVIGIEETITALKTHIFNNVIWPDFTAIPNKSNPVLTFRTISIGESISIERPNHHLENSSTTDDGNTTRLITALPVQHSIPGNGYWIDSGEGALVFSGDTGPAPEFWQAVNHLNGNSSSEKASKQSPKNNKNNNGNNAENVNQNYLKHLIIETSFTNAEQDLAKLSGHYHPAQLAADLQLLQAPCSVWITHLKPGFADAIMAELHQDLKTINSKASDSVQALKNVQVLVF
jgi:glyoxylase-like metal-dependent hydrolase (beta-lactamase superfamily II)